MSEANIAEMSQRVYDSPEVLQLRETLGKEEIDIEVLVQTKPKDYTFYPTPDIQDKLIRRMMQIKESKVNK